MFSYAHRVYHLDATLKTLEERNRLFNTDVAGNGYVLSGGFMLGESTRAFCFGGYDIDTLAAAEA